MAGIEIDRPIAAPPERVWQLITDLDGSAERLSGIESLERISGPEFGVGTRWRETRIMFGKEATEEMEITAIDDGRSYNVGAESHGSKYLSEFRVEGSGEGSSVLSLSFDAEPQTFVAKLMMNTVGRLFKGATRKALAKDLDDIAASAEAESRP